MSLVRSCGIGSLLLLVLTILVASVVDATPKGPIHHLQYELRQTQQTVSQPPHLPYTIMSMNMLACRWLDSSYYVNSYPNVPLQALNSSNRLAAFERTFREMDPDLAFFQEVSDEPELFTFFLEQGYQYAFTPHLPMYWSDWDVASQSTQCWTNIVGNVVAVRRSMFEIQETIHLDMSLDGNRAPLVTVADKQAQKNLTLVSVHLATEQTDAEKQLDFLLGLLGGKKATASIIGGDFNADFTARIPFSHGASHSPTHPYCDQAPEIFLDHIYLSRDLLAANGTVHSSTASSCPGRVLETMEQMGSDHYPVKVQFGWPLSPVERVVEQMKAAAAPIAPSNTSRGRKKRIVRTIIVQEEEIQDDAADEPSATK